MVFEPGDVVLVPFPFRDAATTKARPAVVVSSREFHATGDLLVAAITSHASRGRWDFTLADWSVAGLKLPSTVRVQLATIMSTRVLHHVGKFSDRDFVATQQLVMNSLAVHTVQSGS
jgi:mRNA interferase MazF